MAFGLVRGLLSVLAGAGLALAGVRPEASAKSAEGGSTVEPLPADVTLTIEASAARGPWTMRVANHGSVPLAIAADARLLMLDVTPRSSHKAEHCELPSDMRPQDDLERPLVLPPGRTYSETFEPRLYCLDGKRLDALSPGSIVVASLGWKGHGTKAPLEVWPVGDAESPVAPRKSILAPPVLLPDEPTPAALPVDGGGGDASDADSTKLTLRASKSLDAASPGEIAISVTLRNEGARAVVTRFRPETLAFDVAGPGGSDHCDWPVFVSAPLREVFTTVAPRGEVELTVLLSAYCMTHALDHAGLLVVRPSLDTRTASGADVGLRTFDGQVIATSPTVVRLRHGAARQPLLRPRLDPIP